MEPDEATDGLEAATVTDSDQIESEDYAEEVSDEEQTEPQEGEESEPGGDSEPAYAVTIDGEERQLSRSEIEKGMMLHKAFTQKTQSLAEEKRQWDGAVNQVREALSREVETVKGWLEFHAAHQPQEPDWDAMTPADEVLARRQWNKQAGQREQAKAIYQQIQQQESQVADQRFLASMEQEFPEWAADTALAEKELAETWVAAGQYGFSRENVLALRDPKVFRVLRDAAAYRALQAKKAEVQARVTEAPRKPPMRSKAAPIADRSAHEAFRSKPTIANAMKLNF